jgi:hypothetical protein
MPAVSKKQQKFMGIVRSIQKGEQPASKFTKDAQDVAKDMTKKDVKKFASTKHKGLPMKKEMLDKLKEMVRVELESCGYTHSVSGKKLKSSGGTGPEDRYLKEMSDKSKKIINKLGKKEKEMFLTMVDMMGFDQVMADYKRDKKAFKQALKDMSENINEKKKMFPPLKMTPKQAKEYKKFIGYAKMGIEYQIDMSLFESAIQEQTVTPINKIKNIKNLVKKDLVSYRGTGAGGNFEISIRNKKVPGYPPSFALLQKDDKKYQDIRGKQFKIKPVAKYFITGSDLNQLKKFGHVGFLAKNRRESVNEVNSRNDKSIGTKNYKGVGWFWPNEGWKHYLRDTSNKGRTVVHNIWLTSGFEVKKDNRGIPHFDIKPSQKNKAMKIVNAVEKRVPIKESVNEARLDPKQLLQQLGGNKFVAMTGAKNLAVDKSKNELHMKIMRNAKGVSHVIIRLTSGDLYDMKFLQVRAGKIKIKSKENGVYADQLGKMFKKNTGLNVRL